jgi:hypothetical protein
MRRAFVTMLIALTAALLTGATAHAAPTKRSHFRFHGTSAQALWSTSTSRSQTDTLLVAVKSKEGNTLFIEQFTGRFSSDGLLVSSTETTVNVTSGFSFTRKGRLQSAHVSGAGLPATRCTWQLGSNLTCGPATIDAVAVFAGVGPIRHEIRHDHIRDDGFYLNQRINGTTRGATASGVIGGRTLTPADQQVAELSGLVEGVINVCTGDNC